jgi:hypothetical protein
MLNSFFPTVLPKFRQRHTAFQQIYNFTLSLKLSSLTFTLLFGHHLLFQGQIFTKLRAENYSAHHDLNTTGDNMASTASLHQLSSVVCVQKLKTLVFEISFGF